MKIINLKTVRIDGDTQSRAHLDDGTVYDYMQAIRDGIELPPIVVFFDGAENWLADGFHRYHAYAGDKRASIPADVRAGTRRDAMLFSFGANCTHGLRRTNEDKRKVVGLMLADPEWSAWSDRQIADRCGVSHPFVAAIRKPEVVPERQQLRRDEASAKRPPVIERVVMDSTPTAIVDKAKPAQECSEDPDSDALAEARHTVAAMAEELDELHDRIAVDNMDSSEEGRAQAGETIRELRAKVKTLEQELKTMRISRDTLQSEVRQLQKQIDLNARELKKSRAAA